MKEKLKKVLKIAAVLIIISIIASFFINIKLVMIILFSILLLVAYIIYKEKIGQELIVAFLIAIAWTSYYTYEYTTPNLMIGKINLFPLVAWTFGLFVLREIYEKLKGKHRFLKITALYVILLFLVEYIGYHVLNIQLNSSYPGLIFIDIIHGPLILKLFYILAGPVYILITDYLGVK